MNKKITIIPSTLSLQKALGTEKDIYNCLGVFSTIEDYQRFKYLSTMASYKNFDMIRNIYAKDLNNCPKSELIKFINEFQINVIVCNSKNDIQTENIDIPIYCLDENIVIRDGREVKLH